MMMMMMKCITRNYSIAGKRPLACLLPKISRYFTLPYLTS